MSDDGIKVTRDLALVAFERHMRGRRSKLERAEKQLKSARRTLEIVEKELARYQATGKVPNKQWFRHCMEDFAHQLGTYKKQPAPAPLVEGIPATLGGTKATRRVEALLALATPRGKKGPAS